MIKQYLNQPYPKFYNRWKLILLLSLFISAFVTVFEPFGLNSLHHSLRFVIIAGYGMVTFVIMVLNSFFVIKLFNMLFKINEWTLKKQLLWLSWILFSIGIGNFMYSAMLFNFWNYKAFWLFQLYTLSIGSIPIVVITVLLQNIKLKQNLAAAHEFNQSIQFRNNLETNHASHDKLCLIADNEKDKLELASTDLLYIESDGNYLNIFYHQNEQLKSTLLRCTLKRAEKQVEKFAHIIKCHRAFLVNIHKIKAVKGNSQGLRLIFNNNSNEVPVSRSMAKKLKELIVQ